MLIVNKKNGRSKIAPLLLQYCLLIFDIMNFFVITACFVHDKALYCFVNRNGAAGFVNEEVIHELLWKIVDKRDGERVESKGG